MNNSALREVQKFTSSFEDVVERVTVPIKPYLGVIARFLLVVTFLEDSLRMVTQWPEQSFYLRSHRGFPWIFPQLFLIGNIVAMVCASGLCIIKKHTEYACAVLFGVIFVQSLGYGLIFDFQFCARTLSVVGGLVIMVADAHSTKNKRNGYIAGLPGMVAPGSRVGAYLQLLGRVLLVGLFLSFILNGEWSLLRLLTALVALIGCVMIVVGFKAKMTSVFLVAFLSITNVMLNNYWTLDHFHPSRDFQKYDFFQTLSVMGGFLLLSNLGAGDLSMDEKKKSF